ncbi:MAG: hypothetical protein DWQ51_11385 [Microcystis wesenbergii TW10]|uniref:Uncharacterized protein n=1 Tax=Microcystis wesenbergii TW10 TaxID=2060474 RepID=A0A3E0LXK7_9CHRO|nr:MAG: hypothetical protein DWQ51_11385 [Microcystis wesenbergii TW10]
MQESGVRSQEIIFICSSHTLHPTPHTPHPTPSFQSGGLFLFILPAPHLPAPHLPTPHTPHPTPHFPTSPIHNS